MIPENLTSKAIRKAMRKIDEEGIPSIRRSKEYSVVYKGKYYPPKHLISIANKFINDEEWPPKKFRGGPGETNKFLDEFGFEIVKKGTQNKATVDNKDAVQLLDDDLDQKKNIDLNFKSGSNLGENIYEHHRKATKKIVDRKHVRMQKSIYQDLCAKHGADNVATESNPGFGTLIDIVLRIKDEYVFYELKTDETVKRCIRGALSQLMEYSYWGHGKGKAKKLIIVSSLKTNSNARAYLEFLKGLMNPKRNLKNLNSKLSLFHI